MGNLITFIPVLPIPAVGWSPDQRALRILDQRLLPEVEVVRDLTSLDEIVDAIRTLAVRGAPAIGVAAAIGLVVALTADSQGQERRARMLLVPYAERLRRARPTAVNLAWAIDRMLRVAEQVPEQVVAEVTLGAGATHVPGQEVGRQIVPGGRHGNEQLLGVLRAEADAIRTEDIAMCAAIGRYGLSIIPNGARVLTHCNAGALATAGIGTALAPLYAALEDGRSLQVYADETRPLRQGARLTAWELARAGIPVRVLPDGAAASLLALGMVDLVLVGADRIAANGDVANKVGTYGVALAAAAHGVPLYVAAPSSTIDLQTATGAQIAIEHRDAEELGPLPSGAAVWNPAFDITPRALVRGYLTDRGFLEPPFFVDALPREAHR